MTKTQRKIMLDSQVSLRVTKAAYKAWYILQMPKGKEVGTVFGVLRIKEV